MCPQPQLYRALTCAGRVSAQYRLPVATKKGTITGDGSLSVLVELRGLEPLTPCMPCRCATSCATAPYCCCPCELSSGSPPKQLKYLRTAFPKIPNWEY